MLLQTGEKMVISIDGLFGLPRKKSAGTSYRNAVHGGLFFCDQSYVDQFVKESSAVKSVNMVSLNLSIEIDVQIT